MYKNKFKLFDSDSLKLLHRRVFFSIIIFIFVYFISIYRISAVMLFPEINNDTYNVFKNELRGEIYDRNGNVLATSIKSRSLSINPNKIKKSKELSIKLGSILNIEPMKLNKKFLSKKNFVWLKRNITPKEYQEIINLGEIYIQSHNEYKRIYPYKNISSHIVGHVDIDQQGQTLDGLPIDGAASELLQDTAILDLIWDSELNEVSVIQEGSDDVFFVVNVTAETEPRERKLDEVKKLVISDYRRIEAVKEARSAAEAAVANPQTDQNTAPSQAFRRNGIGLDHEAAGLIANVAFAQDSGNIQVVETGREAIAVRTIDIIPASDDELKETTELVLTVMNNAIRDDMTNLLLLTLSQKHDLQLNLPAIQELLLGASQ